jgi:UDP-N-acetylglucosamine pyrophosphorylase
MMAVDLELGKKILAAVNASRNLDVKTLDVDILPHPDGKDIFVLRSNMKFPASKIKADEVLDKFSIPRSVIEDVPCDDGTLRFNFKTLQRLGLHLIPYLSYGILNGGMATSYCDIKNNSKFNPELFAQTEAVFSTLSEKYKGQPKGITPAYINPDGTPGYDFIELKMRSVLRHIQQSQKVTGKPASEYQHAIFQMTSDNTDDKLASRYKEYKNSPILKELIAQTGVDITEPESAIQPLIPAFTPTAAGYPLSFFKDKNGDYYGLPGGHGQNFIVLRDIYKKLLAARKKFVYLGNVDNIGFTITPVELAVLALSGRQATFDFSFKTPVDVKGGILIRERNGHLTCGDIGRAVSDAFVKKNEDAGIPILFNCATGLFNLEYLVEHLDMIIENLPIRLSSQNKDIGQYSQAEQITWEVIGLLDNLIIFAVEKYERFIASKLLMDNMLASDLECCRNYLAENEDTDFVRAVRSVQKGLVWNLKEQYGLELKNGRWVPSV